MGRSELAIVIPARNEEKTIKKVILSLKKYGDILVIDDHSSDKSQEILKTLDVQVIRNKKNLGYEETVLRGIKYLLKKKYKYIATFDADDEHDPKFFEKFEKYKKYDLIIGKRKKFNRISEYIFSYLITKLYGIEDPLSGLKIYKHKMLKKIHLSNEKLLNTFLIFKIKNLRGKITHKNLSVKKRKDNSRMGNSFFINVYLMICLIRLIRKIRKLKNFSNLK